MIHVLLWQWFPTRVRCSLQGFILHEEIIQHVYNAKNVYNASKKGLKTLF